MNMKLTEQKAQRIFRLSKAFIFIVFLICYGLAIKLNFSIWVSIMFACVLALYLMELYSERKVVYIGIDFADGVETTVSGYKKGDKISINKIEQVKKKK